MGSNMPYQLEKGPYFSVTESMLDPIDMRIQVLIGIRQHTDPDAMPTLESDSLNTNVGSVKTHDQRIEHENHEWYGKHKGPDGRWYAQPPFDANHPVRTGYWHNWYGDAEGIIRETYARAIEVSLGIPHDPTMLDHVWIDTNKKRTWPIEIFTRCPAPWFEGWVTWRGNSPTNGHVTIHVHTPSHDNSLLLTSPLRPGYSTPEYLDEIDPVPLPADRDPKPPLPYSGEHGMWVVAHENQELVPTTPAPGPITVTTDGKWTVPWFGGMVHSNGKIVVVRPSEPNGGVLADGRPYLP
jgi:hypothetical protein